MKVSPINNYQALAQQTVQHQQTAKKSQQAADSSPQAKRSITMVTQQMIKDAIQDKSPSKGKSGALVSTYA
jgi:hypothetical protein